MKMTELTKEWLQKTIIEIEDVLNANPNKGNDSDVVNMLAALKIAQYSLRAETVLYMNRFTRKAFTLDEQPGADKEPNIYIPLCTAPPAPVVPREMPKGLAGQIVSLLAHNIGDKFLAQKNWNTCRTAMLQGDKS